jgi:hypothetical protein
LLYIESHVEVKIKVTGMTKKKGARPASPPVMPVEATPTLRFPPLLYSIIFLSDPRVILERS